MRFYVNKKVKKSLNVSLMGFTSNRDELANIMASCDYFLHGSAAETYGLVIAEALCSGLPIVVPNKGGSADLARQLFSETYEAGNKEELKKLTEQMVEMIDNGDLMGCYSLFEAEIRDRLPNLDQESEAIALEAIHVIAWGAKGLAANFNISKFYKFKILDKLQNSYFQLFINIF